MKGIKIYVAPVCVLLFFSPLLTTAQIGPQQTVNRPHIELSNQFPSPGERVEASIRNSNAGNVSGDITWRINGSVESEFNNQRTIVFTANEVHEPTTLSVYRGTTQLAERSLLSAYVDIIVEPNTTTPRPYFGRPLPVPGSTMTLTALHEISTLVANDQYSYAWRVNNSVVNNGPNAGEDRVTVQVPNRRTVAVSVDIIHPTYGVVAQEQITVPVADPELHFYKISSLYGVSPHTIELDRSSMSDIITVRAVPYYMPAGALDGRLSVEWRAGSRVIQSDETNLFTQRITRADHNNERIRAMLRHPQTPLYSVSNNFLVNFYD